MTYSWFVTQGCYLPYATPIAKPQPGVARQALAPSCSVKVEEIMKTTFGDNVYSVFYACVLSINAFFWLALLIQTIRLALLLRGKKTPLKQFLDNTQFDLHVRALGACSTIFLWAADPWESRELWGKDGGRVVFAFDVAVTNLFIMQIMHKTWNRILTELNMFSLPPKFGLYSQYAIVLSFVINALPLRGSGIWGFQIAISQAWLLIFAVLNSVMGWKVLQAHKATAKDLPPNIAGTSNSGPKIPTNKIVMIAFGISNNALGAWLLGSLVPLILFTDAHSGSDLEKAWVQSADFIAWRVAVLTLFTLFGGFSAFGYFLYSYKRIST